MITTRLMGQLGNQMFQIAAAIGHAKKHGFDYAIPPNSLNESIWPSHKFSGVKYWGEGVSTLKMWHEPHHHYDEIPAIDNIILDGYWQSYKYFDFCREDILKAFDLPQPWGSRICSVHVRRGDYLRHPTKHPVVTEKYLEDAIRIGKEQGALSFLFFSDDIEWTKEYVRQVHSGRLSCGFRTGFSAIDDMSVMKQCQINIISNSTFSWWAAYLNQHPNKIVITPDESNWFGPDNAHLDVKDLLPKDWIRIKY